VAAPPDSDWRDYAMRIAYLIDPEGVIRHAYEVTDTAGFAEAVLADLGG
jgi:peroxiredoxin